MGYNAPNDADIINQQGDGIIISLTNALMTLLICSYHDDIMMLLIGSYHDDIMTLLIGSYHDDIISDDGIGGRWDMGGYIIS